MKKVKHKRKIIILLIIASILFMPSYTPKIKDNNNIVLANSVSELFMLELGGVNQSVMIRGQKKDNPVMLFLHGGPGYPFISYAREFQSQLEKNFVVVNWDQRGSGKSYSISLDENTMTQDQIINDTIELIDYLRNRFQKDKIYLVGHSWGTILGVEVAQIVPEKIAAYVGVGQVVDDITGEKISYDFALTKAKEDKNDKAITQLQNLGEPPYVNPKKDTFVQRKWLNEYGGFERDVITLHEIVKGIIFRPEYTWIDGFRFLRGNSFSIDNLFDRTKVDFRKVYTKFEVPVYFVAGRYDYNTPSELVSEYYNLITAPAKRFYWFEESAHEPHLMEENKFNEVMIEILNEIEITTN